MLCLSHIVELGKTAFRYCSCVYHPFCERCAFPNVMGSFMSKQTRSNASLSIIRMKKQKPIMSRRMWIPADALWTRLIFYFMLFSQNVGIEIKGTSQFLNWIMTIVYPGNYIWTNLQCRISVTLTWSDLLIFQALLLLAHSCMYPLWFLLYILFVST